MTQQRKHELYETIIRNRFSPIENALFDIMDEYGSYIESSDFDGQAELLFYRGEAYFRLGNYEQTVKLLTQCIHIPKSYHAAHIDASSYNILGLMYSYLGQESLALEHFLMAVDIEKQHQLDPQRAVCYINIGFLYRDLDDYDRALEYYDKALEAASHMTDTSQLCNMSMLCNAYRGQIFCKLGQFDDALEILDMILAEQRRSPSTFYDLSIDTFCYRIYDYLGNKAKTAYYLQHLMDFAKSNCDFLEHFEFYYDIGCYLLEKSKSEPALRLLRYMECNCSEQSPIFIQLKFQHLKVRYYQAYGSTSDYLNACQKYVTLSKQYHAFNRSSKLFGIEQLELLHHTQKERKLYEEKSQKDSLTGLLNKYTFEILCKDYLSHAAADSLQMLALLDLDHFKQINDTYGHLMGDKIIKDVADILQALFQTSHLCGRAGGDEFVICFKDLSNTEEAIHLLEEFQSHLTRLSYEDAKALAVTSSIGLAYKDYSGCTFEELFICADNALYEVKTSGRNNIITKPCKGN